MWLLLVACQAPETDSPPDTGILDHRADPGPAPESGFQQKTPEYLIPAHTDVMYCFFGRYTGPDAGVTYYDWFQDTQFGHHLMTLQVDDDEPVEDGTVVDCSDPAQSSMVVPPLFQGTESVDPPNGRMVLPEGVAIHLRSGQRWAIQSHYVNTGDRPVLVQDAINVVTQPAETVQTWAATYVVNSTQFDLPPGKSGIDLSCTWSSTRHLINLMGHMHQNGRKIYIYHNHGEAHDLLYSVEDWTPSLVTAPILDGFPEGEPVIAEGDRMEVQCDYDNTTGADLQFPEEMCVATGIAWPSTDPFACDVPVTQSDW